MPNMIKRFFCLILLLVSYSSFSQEVFRPSSEMIQFKLVNNHSLETVSCTHSLLSHVPWWKVICDDRAYTVDLWIQIRKKSGLNENTVMYHVKESVSSSGTKLTQFKSHFTSFFTRGNSELLGIVSHIDVRNGLADLIVEVK